MSKFCTQCGTALSEDSRFCEFCGARQSEPSVSAAPGVPTTSASQCVATEPAVKKKRIKTFLICTILLLVAVAAFYLIAGNGAKTELPFCGIKRGDTTEKVERQMGKPDDFEDNGSSNFHYYYFDIEFLDMKGYVDIHFKLSKVDTLSFVCSTGTMYSYNRTVKYYTKKYGEPSTKISDFSDYYNESERSWWELEDGSIMMVEYHSAGKYEKPTVYIEIYY